MRGETARSCPGSSRAAAIEEPADARGCCPSNQEGHMPTKEQGHIVETAVEARAGYRDRPVAVVLVVSTACVVVAFAAIYFGFFAS
jgi:cobalamin biosynthesis Mg chelatase CobN